MKIDKHIGQAKKADIIDDLLGEVSELEKNRLHMRMRIAANIDDLMKQLRVNKVKLADMLDKHPSEITKWLSGTHNFTTDTLSDVAFVLQVNLEQLVALKQTEVIYTKNICVRALDAVSVMHSAPAGAYIVATEPDFHYNIPIGTWPSRGSVMGCTVIRDNRNISKQSIWLTDRSSSKYKR